jgi:hypothetical protein
MAGDRPQRQTIESRGSFQLSDGSSPVLALRYLFMTNETSVVPAATVTY